MQKLLNLIRFHLFIFISIPLRDEYQKNIAALYVKQCSDDFHLGVL